MNCANLNGFIIDVGRVQPAKRCEATQGILFFTVYLMAPLAGCTRPTFSLQARYKCA